MLRATLVLLARIILENPSAGLSEDLQQCLQLDIIFSPILQLSTELGLLMIYLRHLNEQNYSCLDCWHDSDQFDALVFS